MTHTPPASCFVVTLALIAATPNVYAFQHQGGGTTHASSFHPLNAHVGSPQPAGHMAVSHSSATHVGTGHAAVGPHVSASHGVSVGGVHHTGPGMNTPTHQAITPGVFDPLTRVAQPLPNSLDLSGGSGFPRSDRSWGLGAPGGEAFWGKPYWPLHKAWIHGYWDGPQYGWVGNRGWGEAFWSLGFLSRVAPGSIGPWGLNPSAYLWAYSGYTNPFLAGPGAGVPPKPGYDYSRPLDVSARPVMGSTSRAAARKFDDARDAFRANDYPRALALIDEVIDALPNDADAHEFRGLTLFFLGRYDESATSLYAVLASGPGWDWPTLASLFLKTDEYTNRLRRLEAACNDRPDDPALRLILAYLYSCQGTSDAASLQFARLAKLLPNDRPTARLAHPAPASLETPPSPSGSEILFPAPPFKLLGTWKATPRPGATVRLNIRPDESFAWGIAERADAKPIKGRAAFRDDVLGLFRTDGPPLAGKVTWLGESRFLFRLVGNGPEDPGLEFSK
jgi:tetratricopeptide (TPR) repeat protein